jgi:hypothetical protein
MAAQLTQTKLVRIGETPEWRGLFFAVPVSPYQTLASEGDLGHEESPLQRGRSSDDFIEQRRLIDFAQAMFSCFSFRLFWIRDDHNALPWLAPNLSTVHGC